MITIMTDLPDEVLGVEVQGKLIGKEYKEILIPAAEEKLKKHSRIRALIFVRDLEGLDAGALWHDTSFGIRHWRDFSHVALVTDIGWVKSMIKFFAPIIPAEVKIFPEMDFQYAREWISI